MSTVTLNNAEFLAGFEQEIVVSSRLPYCQVQNPPNLSIAQLNKNNPDVGIFIPSEQAVEAAFTPDANWVATTLSFGNSDVEGYLASTVRFVVIAQSPLYVREKTERGYRNLGVAYEKGKGTKYLSLYESDFHRYNLRSNIIVMFVDANNKPLHVTPIKLGLSSAVGTGISIVRRDNVNEISAAIFKAMNKPKQTLSYLAQSLFVTELKLGYVKPIVSKAAYLYPVGRLSVNGDGESNNKDKKTTLTATSLQNLVIPKSSETGKIVLDAFVAYESYFSTLFKNNDVTSTDEVTPSDSTNSEPTMNFDIPF